MIDELVATATGRAHRADPVLSVAAWHAADQRSGPFEHRHARHG